MRLYEGWLFPSFSTGMEAMFQCAKERIHPTVLRLYDEDETRLSMAMQTNRSLKDDMIAQTVKAYLQHVRKFSVEQLCVCIVGFEGTKPDVESMRERTGAVFRKFNAFYAGTGPGKSWLSKKYDLPYLRDLALGYGMWADVFETAVLYGESIALWKAVKEAVQQVWKETGQRGWIGCHAAHQYRTGCCLYFTFSGAQKDDRDMEQFIRIKKRAMEAILRCRGSLSHHHGIGYEHTPWMQRFVGECASDLLIAFKMYVDPKNVCNPGKLLPPPKLAGETPQQTKERREKLMMFDKMGVPSAAKL